MSPLRRPIVRRALARLAATAGVSLVVMGIVVGALPGRRAHAASASVVRALGYQATVAGWTSWYGSYGMGSLGPAWCIDHGIPAPDPSYGYVPTAVVDHAAVTTRAMAWAVGRYGPGADRPTAAALTLVLHDLAGAVYPVGRIDLDRLTTARLSGFAGDEARVLARARQIKADAVAHAGLVPPLRLAATRAAGQPAIEITVTDGSGRPVPGAAVTVDDAGAGQAQTDGSGRIRLPAGGGTLGVTATVPDLTLDAFTPSRTVAQRVARPAVIRLHIALPATRPATTTTVAPPATTTTVPPPATTTPATRPATTTTVAPPATTTTVARRAIVRPTTPPPTPPAPPAPAAPVPVPAAATATASAVPPPPPPMLPFTGAPVRSLVWIGTGLALTGGAALLGSRPPQPRGS